MTVHQRPPSVEQFLHRLLLTAIWPLVVLACLGIAAHFCWSLQRAQEAATEEVTETVKAIDGEISLLAHALSLGALWPWNQDGASSSEVHRHAQQFRSIFGAHLLVVDESMRMLMNTRVPWGQPLPTLPAEHRYHAVIAAAESGRPVVGEVCFGPVAGERVLPIAVPIPRAAAPAWTLMATIEVSRLERHIRQKTLPAGWTIRLVDLQQQHLHGHQPDEAQGWLSRMTGYRVEAPSQQARLSVVLTVDRWALYRPLAINLLVLMAGLWVTAWAALTLASRQARELASGIKRLAVVPHPGQAGQPVEELQCAQTRLSQSTATLGAALQGMQDGVCVTDAQGRPRQFNLAFCRFLRFASVEEADQSWPQLADLLDVRHGEEQSTSVISPEAAPRVPLMPVLCEPPHYAFKDQVYWLQRLDTGEQWVGCFSYAPIRNEDGDFAGGVYTARDITDSIHTRKALESTSQRLRQMIHRMTQLEEMERRRIARELHDDLQQKLAAITLTLAAVEAHVRTEPQKAVAHLQQAGDLAVDAIDSVRCVITNLRPQLLDDLGLTAALQYLTQSMEATSPLACDLNVKGRLELPPDIEVCLFRIAQEALNNVRKHAQAHSVCVQLDLTQPGEVLLTIGDDGVGFPKSFNPSSHSFGLMGMRERIEALNGDFQISGSPGQGVQLRVRIRFNTRHRAGRLHTMRADESEDEMLA